MAKQAYKIPDSLAKSFLDIEVALQSQNNVGLKPIPIRVILAFVASGLLCFWLCLNSFVNAGGPVAIIAFVVLWALLSFLLLKPDKSGVMPIFKIPILLNYIPKSARNVMTRSMSPAGPFYSIVKIDHIDHETGIIHFDDGSLGGVFEVVGSASILLFEEDKNAIIDRVDSFFRKMKCDYELIFVTSKEAQNVSRQVDALDERISGMIADDDDPELLALAKSNRRFLSDRVGKSFKSIHQYLIIKAPNEEAYFLGRGMLESEVGDTTLFIKRCAGVFDDDPLNMLGSIYKGRESL